MVENGSDDDQKLGDDFVRSFGPEFRYLDLDAEATPTPADALNRGRRDRVGPVDRVHDRRRARAHAGRAALRHGRAHDLRAGGRRHPAVVRRSRPAGRRDATGYDQAYEDGCSSSIEWPSDGYRLFEIGHFIGDRDWLDGLWESNCMFVPRKLLEQVGGFDESFSMPGGGYANLDFYERLGVHARTSTSSRSSAKGSFHQVHGGTTTNQADADGRRQRIVSYADHYTELRGRAVQGTGQDHPLRRHDVPDGTANARPPHDVPTAFLEAAVEHRPRRSPDRPVPDPDELTTDFIDAFWHSLAWRDTTWLGRPVYKAPTDLFVYQELIAARAARLDHRDRHGRAVGGRCSSRRSASSSITARCSRSTRSRRRTDLSTRASPTSRAWPTRTRSCVGSSEIVGDVAERTGRARLVPAATCG